MAPMYAAEVVKACIALQVSDHTYLARPTEQTSGGVVHSIAVKERGCAAQQASMSCAPRPAACSRQKGTTVVLQWKWQLETTLLLGRSDLTERLFPRIFPVFWGQAVRAPTPGNGLHSLLQEQYTRSPRLCQWDNDPYLPSQRPIFLWEFWCVFSISWDQAIRATTPGSMGATSACRHFPDLLRSCHEPRLTTKDENEPRVRQDGILSHIYFRSRYGAEPCSRPQPWPN